MTRKSLLIFGIGEFAEIACEYFGSDSDYTVEGFLVDSIHKTSNTFKGLPVYVMEEISDISTRFIFNVFIAISAGNMNMERQRLFQKFDSLGIELASYVSSKAFVWRDVEIGRNVFIFEDNTLQIGAKVDDNSILWSGNHIGHKSRIGKNVFISSHCVVSGFCKIGDNSYLGVNCTVSDSINIAEFSLVGAASFINRDTEPYSVNVGSPFRVLERKSIK